MDFILEHGYKLYIRPQQIFESVFTEALTLWREGSSNFAAIVL